MHGERLLSEHLREWSAQNNVTLHWVKGTLRLEMPNGDAGTVVSIPHGFWDLFERVDRFQRESALDAIRLSVAVEYRPPAGVYAHDIKVPLNLVQAV
ncbi:MAG: hypothetical protein ACO1PM_08785 [Acidovorax sp.]